MEELVSKKPVVIPRQTKNFAGNPKDLDDFTILLKTGGVAGFNNWARNSGRYGLDLRGIHLNNSNLTGIHLVKASLDGAKLSGVSFDYASLNGISADHANLTDVTFKNANLMDAFMQDSHVTNGSMEYANLYGAHFKNTTFRSVNMSYANLNGADLRGSTLTGVIITGTSTWGVNIDSDTKQKNLTIKPFLFPFEDVLYEEVDTDDDSELKCNNIEIGHLLFLLSRKSKKHKSEKVKSVIDALTEKIVLILGNFRRSNRNILYGVRNLLCDLNYVPIIFDFSIPKDRDMIETVAVLAGLSRFVIADFTHANSTPLEALLVISGFKVPFKPIIRRGYKIFPMFYSLQKKYNWVLDTWEYNDKEDLLTNLKTRVIAPCEKFCKKREKEIKNIQLQNTLGKQQKIRRQILKRARRA